MSGYTLNKIVSKTMISLTESPAAASPTTENKIINDFEENYGKVRKLLDEDCKNDPKNKPYMSKYKAKDILSNMQDSLKQVIDSDSNLDRTKLDAMLGVVLLNIGIVDIETVEFTASEKVLTECEELLLPNSTKPEVVLTLMNVYNHLGILWSFREDPYKAKSFLLKAKNLYESFKCTLQMPIPIEQILSSAEDPVGNYMLLEKDFTLTLYYLAQVYGTLKEPLKSAIYCHVTLRRQLQYTNYEPIDWALNSATLSQFFAEQCGFLQSRHHLAAASTILEQYEEKLHSTDSNDETYLARLETFKHRSADVARCWAKYCLLLMSASKARLMDDDEGLTEAITDMTNLNLEDDDNIYGGNVKNLVFPNLDVSKYEYKIGDKFLLTYQDVREVFLSCQSWLNKAKEYYKLKTLASDYIELIQDNSESYNILAFFEENDERRSKLLKKRINMLEDLVKEISPTYYMQYCRQLWLELGQVYSDILNIKLEKLNKTKEKPLKKKEKRNYVDSLKKINMFCEKSIENYDHFLDSVKDKNWKMPNKLDCDLIRPVVSAYAFIGGISMKRIPLDRNMHLSYMKKSLDSYEAVVDICTKDNDAALMMEEEFSLCEEMAKILPIKINRVEAEMEI